MNLRRTAFAFGWLLAFAAAGAAVLPLLGWSASHKMPAMTRSLLATGVEFGLDFYLFALFFGLLPGVRQRARPAGRMGPAGPLGPAQAVWALLGFAAMLAAGGLAAYNVLLVGNLALAAAHAGWHADMTGRAAMVAAAWGGEAAAALWICWLFAQAGPAQLADGRPCGLAWRAAPAAAYALAGACAAAIIAVVMALYHFVPPDQHVLDQLPAAQLFKGTGAQLVPMLLLVTLVGPVVEELVFRGAAFAGFARRFGALGASLITTVIFMAVHAAEKLHYLPGFIDVGLMAAAACWLRVKYGSLKPGIALHILYNTGLLFAAGLSG